MNISNLNAVARKVGVSVSTVSRAITRPEKVRTETREKIQKVLEEMQYRPNRVARRLRQRGGRRNLLGIIIPDIQNPFFSDIVRGVEDVAYAHQFAVMLCNSNDDFEKEGFYLDVLRSESVDGIILPPINHPQSSVIRFAETGIPFVMVDRRLDHPAMKDLVETDNRHGAFDAVDHLARQGHKRIGLLLAQLHVSTSIDRKQGYEDALKLHHIPFDPALVRIGDYKQAAGLALTEELLSLKDPPTAIFASNHQMTLGAIQSLKRRKLKMPEQLALVGFGDAPWTEMIDPPLSVIRQPAYALGRAAADLLVKRLGEREAPAATVRLLPQLIVRQSS